MVVPETLSLFQNMKMQSRMYLFESIRTARQAYITRKKTVFPFSMLNIAILKIFSSLQL